jgi:hypothetical protein
MATSHQFQIFHFPLFILYMHNDVGLYTSDIHVYIYTADIQVYSTDIHEYVQPIFMYIDTSDILIYTLYSRFSRIDDRYACLLYILWPIITYIHYTDTGDIQVYTADIYVYTADIQYSCIR